MGNATLPRALRPFHVKVELGLTRQTLLLGQEQVLGSNRKAAGYHDEGVLVFELDWTLV